MSLREFLTEPQIFLNPDILSIISRNFNLLSERDRLAYISMFKNIPEFAGISTEDKDKIIKDIFEAKISDFKQQYISDVISNIGNPGTFRHFTYEYSFAVVFGKDKPKPSINLDILHWQLSYDPTISRNSNIIPYCINKYLDNGYIWKLNGLAGIIKYFNVFVNQRSMIKIYCNDMNSYTVKLYTKSGSRYFPDFEYKVWCNKGKIYRFLIYSHISESYTEKWFNSEGLLHREKGPAFIISDIENNVMVRTWYKDGNIYRDNGYAEISEPLSGDKIQRYLYENGKLQYVDRPNTDRR